MYIPSNISIQPKWSNAEISTLLKVNPILVVPVERIPELDANKSGYSLVFYYDSIGHIQSVLKCYVPTIEYDTRVKSKYSATDFTGYMYEITMDSKIRKVIKLKDGKILGELTTNNLKSVGFRDDGPCYSFGSSWWDRISSFFGSIWTGVSNFFGDSGISSNNSSGGGSNNYSPTSSSGGYDGTFASYGGGSSAIINQGNQNNLPNNYISTNFQTNLFNLVPYPEKLAAVQSMQKKFEDVLTRIANSTLLPKGKIDESLFNSLITEMHGNLGLWDNRAYDISNNPYVVSSIKTYLYDEEPKDNHQNAIVGYDENNIGYETRNHNSGGIEVAHDAIMPRLITANGTVLQQIIGAYHATISNPSRPNPFGAEVNYKHYWIEVEISIAIPVPQ